MTSLTGIAQVCNFSAVQADRSVFRENLLVQLTVFLIVLLLQTGGKA